MLAAAPILCALLATYQVPTGTLDGDHRGSRVRGLAGLLGAASGLEDRASPGTHWPSPFTYGETASGPSSQYNGRVFDPGTGFHDYGARMYWPQIGRFISADSVMGSPGSPATLNRYSYVLNNPYKYVDPTGNWPTPTHNAIIGKAFPFLSAAQQNILKNGSEYTDRPGNQINSRSNLHAMRAPGQSVDDAKIAIAARISEGEVKAGQLVGVNGGSLDAGLYEWSGVNHTIMDSTSPVHVDGTGAPLRMEWTKFSEHMRGEAEISSKQMESAVDASRASFGRALGKEALRGAIEGVCK